MLSAESTTENVGSQKLISRDEQRHKRVEIYVACNFLRDITLESIAAHVGLSRTAFCRWMRQHTSTTFAAYLLNYRLQKACEQLLAQPSVPVSQICYLSGFSDVSHFTRMFKREFGVSPNQFREKKK